MFILARDIPCVGDWRTSVLAARIKVCCPRVNNALDQVVRSIDDARMGERLAVLVVDGLSQQGLRCDVVIANAEN